MEARAYTGVELNGKTVGVVGLGRIGLLVAQRLAAFDVRLIAYDPYIEPARAAQLGVELVSLEELLRRADFISIHLPKTPETLGLIGKDQLALTKRGVIIVNAARGGLVDEEALAEAVRSGQVGGAGIDVYVTEPTTYSPLFELPQVVVTPHLGASTDEAQDKAGTAVARSVQLALQGEFVPDAVNVQVTGVVAEDVRPWLPLAEKLGTVLHVLAGRVPSSVTVEVRGELASRRCSVLQLAVLQGVFTDVVEEQVTYVNAPLLAEERGVEVELTSDLESDDYRNLVQLRGAMPDGEAITVSGTLIGRAQVEKLVEVNGRTSTCAPRARSSCSSTPTGRASWAGSGRCSARPRSTSRPPRSARPPTARTRSCCSAWTGRSTRACSSRSARPSERGRRGSSRSTDRQQGSPGGRTTVG